MKNIRPGLFGLVLHMKRELSFGINRLFSSVAPVGSVTLLPIVHC